MRTESTRNGMSSETTSTMVCGERQPCSRSFGTNARTSGGEPSSRDRERRQSESAAAVRSGTPRAWMSSAGTQR